MGFRDLFRSKPIEPLSKRIESDVIALQTQVNDLSEQVKAMVDDIEETRKRSVRMERFMYRHKTGFQPEDDEDQFKLPIKEDLSWLNK